MFFFSETNEWSYEISKKITNALEQYAPCIRANCRCHKNVTDQDLVPFRDGITKKHFANAQVKGTKYQVLCIIILQKHRIFI